jgi:hypothetical protein
MGVGVTQIGGAGTTIEYYSDASSPDAIAYHAANFATAFPVDEIDNTTTPKSYRSKVSLQCGAAADTALATTWQDTDVNVFFDTGKVPLWNVTGVTNWNLELGTKVGSGNRATGRNGCGLYVGGATTFRGNFNLYDSRIISQGGALGFTPATSGSGCELVDVMLGNNGTATTATIALGSSASAIANIYNVDIWSRISGSTTGILITLNAVAAERITIGGPSMGSFIKSAQAVLNVKDIRFFGTPSTADIVCSGSSVAWNIVRPGWSGNAPRFGSMSALITPGMIREWWEYDVKVVDVLGVPVSNIPVDLTDVLGNIAFSTVTDTEGRVTFNSGLTENAVPVRDYYGTGSGFATRDRWPYTVRANVGAGSNPSYAGVTNKFEWPGASTGNFSNVIDVLPLLPANPAPITVSTLLEASGADQIICRMPRGVS